MRKTNLALLSCMITVLFLVSMAVAQDGTSSSADTAGAQAATAGDDNSAQATSPLLTPPDSRDNDLQQPSLIKRLGTPFAFSVQPNGAKLGPLTITDLSNSGFAVFSSAPGYPSQTLWGTTTAADVYWQNHGDRNNWIFQTTPEVSVTSGTAYLNMNSGLAFTRQISERWSMSATNQFSYLQNSFLQNPQNVLAYGNGGYYLQTIYAQQRGAATYDSSNMSMSYLMSGRNTLTITPQIGLTFADQFNTMNFVTYFGGGATINHNFSASRSISFNYNYVYSKSDLNTAGAENAWNTNTFGAGFRQQFGQTWWLTGNLSASYQSGVNSYWLPVGSIALMKTFRTGTFSVGYSRSQAEQVLLSSGYFDQADFGYSRNFGRKFSASIGAAAFRTVETVSRGQGERAFGSIYYRWVHNLAWVASYNYTNQTGNARDLNLGTTTYISVGLRWMLGRTPGL
jgi:hypothetical protein